MTLNGAIMQLTELWNHPTMPVQFKPAIEKVIETVSELEEHTPERTETWIPASEQLPQARQSVIISTKEWTGEGCYWETTEHHVIWKGYRWNATYWDDEVTAWMPLPKAYKEQ